MLKICSKSNIKLSGYFTWRIRFNFMGFIEILSLKIITQNTYYMTGSQMKYDFHCFFKFLEVITNSVGM